VAIFIIEHCPEEAHLNRWAKRLNVKHYWNICIHIRKMFGNINGYYIFSHQYFMSLIA